jgi:hypothetical protein
MAIGIAKAIGNSSGEALDIEFGSLYPALKRLDLKGWIAARWETSAHNRRAKYYRLTPAKTLPARACLPYLPAGAERSARSQAVTSWMKNRVASLMDSYPPIAEASL